MFSKVSSLFGIRLRFRHYFAFFGTIIAALALFGTAPGAGLISVPFGADVIAKLSALPAAVFAVFILHWGIKALFDFIDFEAASAKALESSNGAGLLMIAVGLSRIAIAIAMIGVISFFAQ